MSRKFEVGQTVQVMRTGQITTIEGVVATGGLKLAGAVGPYVGGAFSEIELGRPEDRRCAEGRVAGFWAAHSSGLKDSKGREIGCSVYRGGSTMTELPAETFEKGYCSYRVMVPGFYFTFLPQATRNGESYGASQPFEFFRTEAEREARIVEYLAGAEKRAAKLAA